MTIECYYGKCQHHSNNSGDPTDEGPFCYQEKCLATVAQCEQWGGIRAAELASKKLTDNQLSSKHKFVRATLKHHGVSQVHTALVADLIHGLETKSPNWTIRPDGDANFFTVMDAENHWLMRVQHNGEDLEAKQLVDVQKLLTLLQGEPDETLHRDSVRYRKLRALHWDEGPLCVVLNPKESLRLGADCPSDSRLDELVDALPPTPDTEAEWVKIHLPEDGQAIEGKSGHNAPIWVEDYDKNEPLGTMRFWRPRGAA